jgi:hypothetical protein
MWFGRSRRLLPFPVVAMRLSAVHSLHFADFACHCHLLPCAI